VHRFAALLFDLDGTLLDSSRAICDAASLSLADLGTRVAPEEIEPHLGAPLDELYSLFIGDGDNQRRQRFVLGYIRHHDEHPERLPPPLPGVIAALEGLRARYQAPLGVATTKPTDRAFQQLEAIGLAHHFTHVQGTGPGIEPKPSPDVIFHACDRLHVKAESALMVGDTARDVDAARAAGAYAVAVAYADADVERAQRFGADLVVRSLEELVGAELP
jgi:HAD superfamily hydrolase (TIGR01509 family)